MYITTSLILSDHIEGRTFLTSQSELDGLAREAPAASTLNAVKDRGRALGGLDGR